MERAFMKSKRPRLLVCPTDFSDNARKAATVAAALAAKAGATLLLLHAANLGPRFLVSATERRTSIQVGETLLKEEARRLRASRAKIETKVLADGWTAEALLAFMRENPPELVVLSSRRMSGLDRWAIGSVSDQIAQHVACPTLVVRDPLPFVAWAEGQSRLKILAALDFGACTDAVLRWIRELRVIGPCELTVCHVNWKLDDRLRASAGGPALRAENPPDLQASLERNLAKKVRDVLGADDAAIVVKATWGAPESVLIEHAEAGGADLIVVGTHQRHGFGWLWNGSVSRGLVHHAPMSVACVPTAVVTDPGHVHVPQFRRVLVTTDFSAMGNAAIPLACATLTSGGVLEVVHVVPPVKAKTAMNRVDSELKQRLLALAPADAERLGVRIEPQVLVHRTPAEAIAREAQRFAADLICLASHGRSGVAKTLFGSVAQDVMTRSRTPVLVVRPPS
jgi:nucleotide-binding universal stress UspA family protein